MRSLLQFLRRPRVSPFRSHPFDLVHGTDTSGLILPGDLRTPHPNSVHTSAYYAMSPSRFRYALELWHRSSPRHAIEDTTFLDLGCGKGRAVLLATEHPFRQVIGVELHPSLADTARQNLALWQAAGSSRCPAQILTGDATEVPLPSGPTLLYLFHPFTDTVMKRLIRSVRRSRNPTDIIYFNPEAALLWREQPEVHRLWSQIAPMSTEDAAADPIANSDDLCDGYRWSPAPEPAEVQFRLLPQHSH